MGDKQKKVFEIVTYNGFHKGCVEANDERQALCIYLMEHKELNYMMLCRSICSPNKWKLTAYDYEKQYLYARETT